MAWMSCEGEENIDKENLGSAHYTRRPGFAGYFFPYLRQMNYQRSALLIDSSETLQTALYLVHVSDVRRNWPRFRLKQVTVEYSTPLYIFPT